MKKFAQSDSPFEKKEFKSVFMVSRFFISGQYMASSSQTKEQAEKINKETLRFIRPTAQNARNAKKSVWCGHLLNQQA